MKIHSDLSGKEWIPKEVVGRGNGYYQDVPRRLYISIKNWHISIGARTQWWDPWHGSTKFWSPVAIFPGSDRICARKNKNHCGKLYGHKGKCVDGRKLWE